MTAVKVGSFSSIALGAFGASQGGFLGLLTGFVTGLVCTVGVSIALGEKESMGSQDPRSPLGRRQRLTGAIVAVGAPLVAAATGWRWGWAAALGVFVGTVGLFWALETVLKKRKPEGARP